MKVGSKSVNAPFVEMQSDFLTILFILKIFYLFILLHQVLVTAQGILDLHCGMWTLGYSMWDLVPWPGIESGPSALGVRSPSHWTTKSLGRFFNLINFFFTVLHSMWDLSS